MKKSFLIVFILGSFFSFADVPILSRDFLSWKTTKNSEFEIKTKSYVGFDSKDQLKPEQDDEKYVHSKIDIEKFWNESLGSNKRVEVDSEEKLKKSLDEATGGEIIFLTKSLKEKFNYFRSKDLPRYSSRVYLLGRLQDGTAPFINEATWAFLSNLTISHLKIKSKKIKNFKKGAPSFFSWQLRNVTNVRISNVHFSGSDDGIELLKQGITDGVFNDPTGIFIRDSVNVLLDRSLFENLFHAVEFQNIIGLTVVSNRADKITSDMFSGGGLYGGLFDSNLSLTKFPVRYKRDGEEHYVHSDVIQLYTDRVKRANKDIIIRNNIVLEGNSPHIKGLTVGWQCFFMRDEEGDHLKRKVENLARVEAHIDGEAEDLVLKSRLKQYRKKIRMLRYRNIRIYNNLCVSNQHHGITLARGDDNVVAGNVILELGQGFSDITARITVKSQERTQVVNNLSKSIYFEDLRKGREYPNIRLGPDSFLVQNFKERYVRKNRLEIPIFDEAEEVNSIDKPLEKKLSLVRPELLNFKELHRVPFVF